LSLVFFQDESGVTAIEYGLIAALIFGRVHRSDDLCRPAAVDVYNRIGNALANALG